MSTIYKNQELTIKCIDSSGENLEGNSISLLCWRPRETTYQTIDTVAISNNEMTINIPSDFLDTTGDWRFQLIDTSTSIPWNMFSIKIFELGT